MVPKTKQEYDRLDIMKIQLNSRAIYFLHCDRNEYNHACQCKLAKEIWRLLEVTHEGTNQGKESKNKVHVHSYKLFFMKKKWKYCWDVY